MKFTKWTWAMVLTASLIGIQTAAAAPLVPAASTWRYFKGTSEASTPDPTAWRLPGFNDSTWLTGDSPFFYENGTGYDGNTDLTDMNGSYSSVFMRHTFQVDDPADLSQLILTLSSDDGCLVWINGAPVPGLDTIVDESTAQPNDPVQYNDIAQDTGGEPDTGTFNITDLSMLVAGANVLAVHAFNGSLSGSSDFLIEASLDGVDVDPIPPTIADIDPAPGQTLNQLNQITVTFSEAVTGVDALDLIVNGTDTATAVIANGNAYTFLFAQPAFGTATFGFQTGHGITDLAFPPNPFDETDSSAQWQYTLVDIFPPVVSAILPSAGTTVKTLSQIQIRFNEGVSGVNASDLLINGSPATSLDTISTREYVFGFAEPPQGTVNIAWAANSGIRDLSPAANAFGGGNWTYNLDPNAVIGGVVITEFLASNDEAFPGDEPSLTDEDGDYEDWIEIYNTGDTTINLLNYALTDDDDDLNQWRFPSTNLLAGEFMVIFASGKNRRIPGAPLHTNFRLGTGGEYLALVRPDGTIASEFNPEFPPQVRNVSYGFGFDVTDFTLIPESATARYLVPVDGTLGDTWHMPGFNDSAWNTGPGPIGYDTQVEDPEEDSIVSAVLGLNPNGFWRFNETSGTTAANLGSLGTGGDGTFAGNPILTTAGPRPPDVSGIESGNTAADFNGTSGYMTANSSLLSGLSSFTVGGWIRPDAAQASRTGLFGQNDAVEFGFLDANTIQIWTPGGGSLNVAYPFPVGEWHHIAAVGNGSSLTIYFDGNVAGTGGGTTANYGSSSFPFNVGGNGIFDTSGNFFNGAIDEVVLYTRALSPQEIMNHVTPSGGSDINYGSIVQTDVESSMSGVNSTLYMRLPFQITDASLVDRLFLDIQYDDGFIAYLNGVAVAMRNAPGSPAWNSTATDRNPDPLALEPARVNISDFVDALQSGDNVLAIHALNVSSDNPDFLIHASLSALSSGSLSSNARYFVTPTPGDPNGSGADDLGPIIRDVVHAPQVPQDNEDLLVTVRLIEAFAPVATVTLHYRVMFDQTVDVAMFDDGAHGDGAAADGVYGFMIPAASLADPGEMIRYYITATDTSGNLSRWPLYEDQSVGGSQEYLGTMVEFDVNSKLPVFYMFIAPDQVFGALDDTGKSGGRIAMFHDGELYDNVESVVRGNSTVGLLKKSHRFNFPRDHKLRHDQAEMRIRDTSFTADYVDPAYIRQNMSYWLANQFGAPTSYYYPVRVQLNTGTTNQFYQLANHNNLIRREILDYLGYDDNGALYQAVGTLQPSQFSTGGFTKRSRQDEDNSDYAFLANSIAESVPTAQRRINIFDQLDVPQVLNYLTVARWAHENDDVWANMSIYRDTTGDGLWRIIPFDMNLSWGAIFAEGALNLYEGVQATNDNHKAHPLYGASETLALSGPGGAYNRMYDAIFDVPETREMFLRRLRTLMDEWVKPPGTHPLLRPFEQRILALQELIREEANRDRARWGWPNRGGQANFLPGIGFDQGIEELITQFVERRRNHFYLKHTVSNTALPIGRNKDQNAGIPLAQPSDASIEITGFEVNPASGNQDEEYVLLTNPNAYAVDISGWELDGAVEFTFAPGTVIVSGGSLYVSPDVNAFRARATGPSAGQGLFVVGNYRGQLSARGESIELYDKTRRLVDTTTYPASPSAAQNALRVTEIMYNPAPGSNEDFDAQDYEFIELKNIGSAPLNLAGIRFSTGITFTFTTGSLAPGETIVLVRNLLAFQERYGLGANVGGVFTGFLDSAGERLVLLDASNEEILDFEYNNAWYPITDGIGFSLVVVDENAEPDLWNDPLQWRPSGALQGTPDADDPGAVNIAGVRINELLTHTDLPQVDFVELINPTGAAVDLGGWYLTDNFVEPQKYRIPNGTSIPANGYLILDENDFNPDGVGPEGFTFSSKGEEVFLFSGDPNGTELTGYFHGYDFDAAANGVSFGPYVDSTGDEQFVPLASLTPEAANSGPRVGPVVISEIMYRPPDRGGMDNSDDEYIELHNITGSSVPLYNVSFPAETWQLQNAVDFAFPTGVSLPADGRLLVVDFDPANQGRLASFRARYGIADTMPIYGPYVGKLDNSDESIRLYRPDNPEEGEFPLIQIERVNYEDQAPWPSTADGTGASLQRIDDAAFGNDPINWFAAAPSPGRANISQGTAPSVVTQPASQNVVAFQAASVMVGASGTAALRYQWRYQGAPIEGATNASYTIPVILPDQSGDYSVVVYNAIGATVSSNATLTVLIPAAITSQPVPLTVNLGNPFTVSVEASSSSPITYQWRQNGVEIPGATGSSYMVASASASDRGAYDVVVTDAIGSVVSESAFVEVLVPPIVVRPTSPLSLKVVQGQDILVGVTVSQDSSAPLGYRWRRGFAQFSLQENAGYQSFALLQNVQPPPFAFYTNLTVTITNQANMAPGLTWTNYITVLTDSDGDLMSDEFEDAHPGLDSGTPDGDGDLDGDGFTNYEESIAGTDPTDPLSYLKIEEIAVDGDIALTLEAAANVSYSVLYKDSLTAPDWLKFLDVAPGQAGPVLLRDEEGNLIRFYQIVTPRVE